MTDPRLQRKVSPRIRRKNRPPRQLGPNVRRDASGRVRLNDPDYTPAPRRKA